MKTRIILLFVALFFFQMTTLVAQSHKFSGIVSIYLRDQGTIVENNMIKGYFFFYKVEKADKKNNNYLLSLLDENLREINSVNIVRPTTYRLLESAYNGDAFAFFFADFKNKMFEIITFDKTCKQIGNKKFTNLTNKELYAYAAMEQGEENTTQTLFGVRGKGFLRLSIEKKERIGYNVEMFSNEMKSLWKTGSSETIKKYLSPTMLDINNEYALLEVGERKGIADKDFFFRLECINLSTGKTVFDMPLTDPKYNLANSNALFDELTGGIVMLGEYYDLKDNVNTGKSLGFYTIEMSIEGNIQNKKFISWEKDVSKLIPVNQKGKLDNKAYVFFHRVVRLKDGKMMAIGEQFKKAASGAGIAMTVLGGGRSSVSVVKMVTMNMMIFEFDKEYNLTAVNVFEKDETSIILPSGIGIYPPAMLAKYINYLGQFDYVYTQKSADNERFTTTYINYDREKGQKPKNVASTIIYADGKYTVDAIPLSNAKTAYSVYPAKPGYIMIAEYAKKEKTLDVRLEKFNY